MNKSLPSSGTQATEKNTRKDYWPGAAFEAAGHGGRRLRGVNESNESAANDPGLNGELEISTRRPGRGGCHLLPITQDTEQEGRVRDTSSCLHSDRHKLRRGPSFRI